MHPALEMIRPVADAVGGHAIDGPDLVEGDILLAGEGQVVGAAELIAGRLEVGGFTVDHYLDASPRQDVAGGANGASG